jgi:hypothetical protein
MIILRAYKTELDLNNKQRTLCAKHAGQEQSRTLALENFVDN